MVTAAAVDDDWWTGALTLAGNAGGGPIGPARMHGAAWQQTWNELLETAPRAIARTAARQGFVLTRKQARRAGIDEAETRRRVRRGEWTVPRRGVLCPLPPRSDDRPHGARREIVAAAAALVRPSSAISHESAAELFGLPVLARPHRPRLTVPDVARAGGWPGCLVHAAPIPAAELDSWYGAPVTTVARTVADISRIGGTGAGLVVADAAVREGLLERGDLLASWQRGRRRPGNTCVARVLMLVDPRAESPLESLTRLCLIDGGLPAPRPQVPIETHRGTYRVDLLIERVIVEADGRRKYRPDRSRDADPLWAEKLRQDALERAGYRIVRVTWTDVVQQPGETVARVRRAMTSPVATF